MKIDRIWKYEIAVTDRQIISLPSRFCILHVGKDPGGKICLWAAVDSDKPQKDLEIIIVGTGNPMPHLGSFLGTVVDGPFVWHIFTGPGHSNALIDFHYMTRENG